MTQFLDDFYLWIKALHLISVISWMAGLLYLPRLFVYHSQAAPGSAASETFKVMEKRLLQAIMHPAMAASILFGTALAVAAGKSAWSMAWLHAKLLLVFGLMAFHFFMARCTAVFARDENKQPQKFYRVINEVPTLLMIGAVILAAVKPF